MFIYDNVYGCQSGCQSNDNLLLGDGLPKQGCSKGLSLVDRLWMGITLWVKVQPIVIFATVGFSNMKVKEQHLEQAHW